MTDLDARYGRRPPLRPRVRISLIVAGIVALIGLAGTVTALYVAGRPAASVEIQSYAIVSDQSVTVTVNVTKPAGRDAACEVRALDRSLDLVGTVTVSAKGGAKHVPVTVTIPTTTRAVGVRAGDCVLG